MKISYVFAGAVFILGCATGAAVREMVVPARAQGQAPVVYQYRFENGNAHEGADLANVYGQQGWRLVSMTGGTMVFERAMALPLAPRSSLAPSVAPAPPAKPEFRHRLIVEPLVKFQHLFGTAYLSGYSSAQSLSLREIGLMPAQAGPRSRATTVSGLLSSA